MVKNYKHLQQCRQFLGHLQVQGSQGVLGYSMYNEINCNVIGKYLITFLINTQQFCPSDKSQYEKSKNRCTAML